MKIAVTFAVPSEFANWRRLSGFTRVDRSALTYRTSIGRHEIYALITGVGAPDQKGLQQLFSTGVDACIVSGLAGALKTEHRVGSILAARAVRAASPKVAQDVSRPGEYLRSDDVLAGAAAQCGARMVDFFCSVNSVVSSSSEKQRLGQIADAVDMESFLIMKEAGRVGIPALAVRAISDAVETNLPLDLNLVLDERGQLRWPALFFELAKSPRQLPAFTRFGADGLSAARRLAVFLSELVKIVALEGSTSDDVDECRDLSRLRPGHDGNCARAGHI